MRYSWDDAIDFFRKHGRDGARRWCEWQKSRGKNPPDGVGTAVPGYDSVEWHDPPRVRPIGKFRKSETLGGTAPID